MLAEAKRANGRFISTAPLSRALVDSCGVRVDALLNGDTTALYLAAQRGHAASVKALLSLGRSNTTYATALVLRRRTVRQCDSDDAGCALASLYRTKSILDGSYPLCCTIGACAAETNLR